MPNIIDKVAWLHIRERKLLMVRSFGKDRFYTVGGKREPGESDVDTLVREVREEVSVHIVRDTATFIGVFDGPADVPDTTVVLRCYFAAYTGKLRAASEIAELRFFSWRDRRHTTVTGEKVLRHLLYANYLSAGF